MIYKINQLKQACKLLAYDFFAERIRSIAMRLKNQFHTLQDQLLCLSLV